MTFESCTAVEMQIVLFLVMLICNPIGWYQCLRGIYCLYLQYIKWRIS
jgi:hypothetical protein